MAKKFIDLKTAEALLKANKAVIETFTGFTRDRYKSFNEYRTYDLVTVRNGKKHEIGSLRKNVAEKLLAQCDRHATDPILNKVKITGRCSWIKKVVIS